MEDFYGKENGKKSIWCASRRYFHEDSYHEDGSFDTFYQVIALRGETQVVVRQIKSGIIAFDGNYEGVVPVLDAWISDEVFVRKVRAAGSTPSAGLKMLDDGICDVKIKIYNCWLGYAHLDRKEMYLSWSSGPSFANIFRECNPEIAKQLDLQNGSGVYAIDRPFGSYDGGSLAVIRYPDGREQETTLYDLLHY